MPKIREDMKNIILDRHSGKSPAANPTEITFQGNAALEASLQLLSNDENSLLNPLFKVLSILQYLNPIFTWLNDINFKVDKLLSSLAHLDNPYYDETSTGSHFDDAQIRLSQMDDGLNVSISELFKSSSPNDCLLRMKQFLEAVSNKAKDLHGATPNILFCVFRI